MSVIVSNVCRQCGARWEKAEPLYVLDGPTALEMSIVLRCVEGHLLVLGACSPEHLFANGTVETVS